MSNIIDQLLKMDASEIEVPKGVHKMYCKKLGKEPRFTVIGKLADPDSMGSERIALYSVSFDDLTLMDWEVGSLGSSEHPFTFVKYDILDAI